MSGKKVYQCSKIPTMPDVITVKKTKTPIIIISTHATYTVHVRKVWYGIVVFNVPLDTL